MNLISRRSLLTGTLSSAAALALPPRRTILAYVGSYSNPQGPEGSHGNGQGIYLFEMNPETGAFTQRAVFPSSSNPSWLAFALPQRICTPPTKPRTAPSARTPSIAQTDSLRCSIPSVREAQVPRI